MRILMILSKEFLTDDRVYKEARALVEEGYEVSIIVWDRHENYPHEEAVEDIGIFRICNRGTMKFLPNDLLRNPIWWRKAYKKGLELYKNKNGYRFDVVHCHDLDTLQTGVWLKKKLGIKLVYDAHEIFGYMISDNMPHIVVKSAFWLERKLIKNVDHAITVNKPLKNYFASITKKPITIVMNCKELISKEYTPPKNNTFTLIYIGVLHKRRFFPEIVDIVGNIKNVKFLIAAKKENIKLYEDVRRKSKNYPNVKFLGTIPAKNVIPLTLKGDAVIAMWNLRSRYTKFVTLNKQFEAMVCGRPIIVTKGTYPAEMTKELKCGLTADYNKESIKETIIKLRDNPSLCEKLGRNALKAAVERYNWENEKRKLLKVYKNILKS